MGDVLIVNGEVFDFTPLPDHATLPRDAVDCTWLVSDVTRRNGVLHLAMILPHGADAPDEGRFAKPVSLADNGPVALPAFNRAAPCT